MREPISPALLTPRLPSARVFRQREQPVWIHPGLLLASMVAVLVGPIGLLAAPGLAQPPEEPAGPLGAPAAFGPVDAAEETILLASGTRLFQSPARRSPTIDLVDAPTTLPVLEHRGAWRRVRWDDQGCWVLVAPPDAIGDDVAPLTSLPADLRPAPADLARVTSARERLGPHDAEVVGGYTVYSDIASAATRQKLLALLDHIDNDLAARVALPVPTARHEAIAVYADNAAFRAFVTADDRRRQGSSHLGQAHAGLAVLGSEGLTPTQLEALFAHEVAHLSIRRMLGISLPPWLEEGLAEELAYHQRDDHGKLIPASLSRGEDQRVAAHRTGRHVIYIERRLGGAHALEDLRESLTSRAQAGLERLVSRDAANFYSDEDQLRYPRAAFFVRFLLDAHSEGFHAYLRASARGDEVGADRLLAHLEMDWPTLEDDFVRWLAQQEPS